MLFDVNRTEFISEKQKAVWQCGTHIVPLEVSLADIKDEETREGCTQIYNCTMEILADMYDHSEEYLYGPRWYAGDYLAWLTKSAAPMKKHSEEYTRYLQKIPQFGFTYDAEHDILSNERYPLFCKYFPRLVDLAKERKKNLGGYLARLDFRLFADKIKLTIDDLLRPLSDLEHEYCLELHNYAISKGLKLQIKDPYCCRYFYKKQYSLELYNDQFRVYVPYHLNKGGHANDALEKFIGIAENEPDRDELIRYLQGGVHVCDSCGGSKQPYERCGRWVTLNGARRLASMCHPVITKYRRGRSNTAYTAEDIRMLKRMIEVRIKQIDADEKEISSGLQQ